MCDESVTPARIVKPFRLVESADLYGGDMEQSIGRAIATLADGAVSQLHATNCVETLIREHRRRDN